jgi:hypothetical protein
VDSWRGDLGGSTKAGLRTSNGVRLFRSNRLRVRQYYAHNDFAPVNFPMTARGIVETLNPESSCTLLGEALASDIGQSSLRDQKGLPGNI